jgi:cholest-4-en-3-one 26-monooxygenase
LSAAAPEIDLLDLDRWALEGAPIEWFDRIRGESPVWWHEARGTNPGFWVVTGLPELTVLGRCPHPMSSDSSHGGVIGLGPGDEVYDELHSGVIASITMPSGDSPEFDDAKMLLTLDPPEHTAHRRLLNRAFTPGSVSSLEPAVRELTMALLVGRFDGEGFDFAEDVAMPLPLQVIGDLLGAPRDLHDELLRLSNEAASGGTDPEYSVGEATQVQAISKFLDLMAGLRAEREENPQDDLISRLLDASVEGEHLGMMRYTMYLLLLIGAGNETTRNAMSHGVAAFAANPDQWQRLREDPSLIPSAVEEIVRYSSPVLYFRRNAVEDMTLSGATIKAGDVVSLWYIAANRDERTFVDPHTFDIGRHPNPHVGFGGGGPHFCLGASLARLELRVLLEEMVGRCSRIELDGDIARVRTNFLHGIKHLPVRLHG